MSKAQTTSQDWSISTVAADFGNAKRRVLEATLALSVAQAELEAAENKAAEAEHALVAAVRRGAAYPR